MQGSSRLRATALACVLFGALATSAGAQQVPKLDWQPCGDAANVVCTKAKVPLDYDRPNGQSISLFVAKSPATDQAHRLGTLFFNFGGPGGSTADYVEAVGADPRGVWGSLNTRYEGEGFSWARRTRACSATTIGWSSTGRLTPPVHHERSTTSAHRRRLRARDRALLPGLRDRSGRVQRVRRQRPVGAYDRSSTRRIVTIPARR